MRTLCPDPRQLVEDHQGLVRSLALQIHRSVPERIELDDLIGYGQVGLAEAARDFDPTRKTEFSTYAYYRVRGAIYDGLSKMTWLSRAQYNRVRYEQQANEVLRLEAEDGGSADETAAAEARWLRDVSRALAVVYLTAHRDDETGDVRALEIEDHSTPSPVASAVREEIQQKLTELIALLPSEAGLLIRAVYYEGLTIQEAGQRLGVSKSWASRLHAKTLQRLARALKLLDLAF